MIDFFDEEEYLNLNKWSEKYQTPTKWSSSAFRQSSLHMKKEPDLIICNEEKALEDRLNNNPSD